MDLGREKDRVLDLLAKGDSCEAWRFAVRGLESRDFDMHVVSCLVLYKLQAQERTWVKPAQALTEDRLARGEDLSFDSKGLLLISYQALEGIGGNSAAVYRGQALEAEARKSASLPDDARAFCEQQIAKADINEKAAAFQILLYGAQLGGKDKEWSVQICRKQANSVRANGPRLLIVLFEAVSNKYYSKT